MKPKILSWNVRGLNSPNKRLRVKNLIRDWKADIICLQETKLKHVDRSIIRSLWSCVYAGWASLPSKGASGGIIVMWDKRVIELVEESIGEFVVACSFKSLEDGFGWGFAGIYGPNNDNHRKLLWDEIAGLCSWWEGPWCIGGDFNTTRFSSERSGDSNTGSAMTDFSALIFELDLLDLPLGGGDYTWSNGRAWSHVDRFIVSPSWETHFPTLCQKRLPRLCSDHFPLMLDCGGLHEGRKYFKFENMWLKTEGFLDKIRSWWSSYQILDTPSFVLAGKLKALKNDLKTWNIETFGNLNDQRCTLFQELQCFEDKETTWALTADEKERKTVVIAELEKITLLEEISCRQKSRALWLKEGDKCTKFFHRVANSHRRTNAIEVLHSNRRIISNRTAIKEHIVLFYDQLLKEQHSWRPKVDGLSSTLSMQQVQRG
ncbi:hypothetical protein CIPAW_12G097200 [Carya illinoinensis]|uniref:Endonuclease/exonuclease/phosphatase domain-containing protein n=1 Tax=Carya illinoinensis TaxID=32201 RepID=A0A8T1NWX3_CARIL|nr:hypothetical protein CIPAW_12G097200 [Carya illinoinensis]